MTLDTAIVLAAIVLAITWPLHQQLTIRALRYSLYRQREQLHQHHRAIIQLQATAPEPPTSAGQPMPTVTRSRLVAQGGVIRANTHVVREGDCELFVTQAGLRSLRANESQPAPAFATDPDPTLRLRRPPALSDVAAAILGAGRPLTRATIETQLDRDVRSEIRAAMLAGTLEMVRTHDQEPAYWPTGHPRPGDTMRLARMPVLPRVRP